ncbi:hypothetical protein [Clostridium kluyveri]|uniref:hypothetical protein n=1 Tax=Clostridium kluyveri TaxID=1534 RepID=UPI0002D74DE7|nr:hypothetical protein [Clostridium kluyveri]
MAESFEKQLIFDLSKEYVFRTFDFQNSTPEDLIKSYQDTSAKIEKVLKEQDSKNDEYRGLLNKIIK